MGTASATAVQQIHVCSWHETHREATDLGARLALLPQFRGIVAISRGGLVPAAIVARVLGIVLVETLCISSYTGTERGPLKLLKQCSDDVGEGDGWLLVDDVADSGSTAAEARRLLPRAHYATLYVKPAGRPHVDTFIREVPQDVWIDFPWDRAPAPRD